MVPDVHTHKQTHTQRSSEETSDGVKINITYGGRERKGGRRG